MSGDGSEGEDVFGDMGCDDGVGEDAVIFCLDGDGAGMVTGVVTPLAAVLVDGCRMGGVELKGWWW